MFNLDLSKQDNGLTGIQLSFLEYRQIILIFRGFVDMSWEIPRCISGLYIIRYAPV